MHLTKMDIKGFGCFQSRVFAPGSGLNIVYGENEAGKSTLMGFVRAMLYGLRGGRRLKDGSLSPLKKYSPWHSGLYAGVLEYALDNGEAYRIGRNFEKNHVHIQNQYAEDIGATFSIDPEVGILFAQAHLGVNENAFMQTLYLMQQHQSPDEQGRRHLMDRLLQIQDAGSDEKTFLKAEEALQKALLERVGSDRSTVRPIDKIAERMKILHIEKGELLEDCAATRALALQLQQTRNRLAESRREKNRLFQKRTLYGEQVAKYTFFTTSRKQKETKNRLAQLAENKAFLFREKAVLAISLADRKVLSDIAPEDVAGLPFHMGRVRELKRTLLTLQQETDSHHAILQDLKGRLPENPLWQDSDKTDAVLQAFLLAKEKGNDSLERGHIAAVTGNRPGAKGRIALIVLGLALLVLVSAQALGLATWIRTMGPFTFAAIVLNVLTGLVAFGFISLASFQMVQIFLSKRRQKSREFQQPLLDTNPELLKQWESARKNMAVLLSDLRMKDVQAFLQSKRAVDTLFRQVSDEECSIALLTEKSKQIQDEIQALSKHLADLLRRADIVPFAEPVSNRSAEKGLKVSAGSGGTIAVEVAGQRSPQELPGVAKVSKTEEQSMLTGSAAMANFFDNSEDEAKARLFQMRLDEYREDVQVDKEMAEKLLHMEEETTFFEKILQELSDSLLQSLSEASPWQNSLSVAQEDNAVLDVGPEEMADESMETLARQASEARQQGLSLQKDIEGIEEQLSTLQTTEATLMARLERMPSEERLQQIVEETDRLATQKQALERYGESLRTAQKILEAAAKEIRQGLSPKLGEVAGNILASITGGRYRKVVPGETLQLSVEVVERETMPLVSELSSGTRDQIWLSVRLAAVQLLEQNGEKLPVFLDEPFAQYDDKRLKNTMDWLAAFAQKRQVFLFTSRYHDVEMLQTHYNGQYTLIALSETNKAG